MTRREKIIHFFKPTQPPMFSKRTSILLDVILFLCSLLCFSAIWARFTFGDLGFETVLFQLTLPMSGTNVNYYLLYGFGPLLWSICTIFDFHLLCNKVDNRHRKKVFRLTILSYFLWILAASQVIGLNYFIYSYFNKSNIFEKSYVRPSSYTVTFPEEKRNLIYIYLESMETTNASIEEGGAREVSMIPELVQLAEENHNFSATELTGGFYAVNNAEWTMGALVASTSAVPFKIPVDAEVISSDSVYLPKAVTLGDLLAEQGYKQVFLCGSDATFAGREYYFTQHGNYEILDYSDAIPDYIEEGYYVNWGHEDSILYERAKDKLLELSAEEQPFNFTMLTVDTHHPSGYVCELCEDEFDDPYANVYACASRQVYAFVQWIMEQDFYENTTIVITGDHPSMSTTFCNHIGDYERNVYNCFINIACESDPSWEKNRIMTTLDLMPTTLAAMGVTISGNRLGLGANLFSDVKTLAETKGLETLNEEIVKYSEYYETHFY